MNNDIHDHPVIANLLATGEPDGGKRNPVVCPICGDECRIFYKNIHDSIFGCENCVTTEDAEYLWED